MSSKIPFPVFWAISVLFFFSSNHFDGFEQDGVLYIMQAFNRISPERFLGDPAFMYGNQDSFSVFSPVYILFLRIFPIDIAAFVFTSLIHLFIASTVAFLFWKWFSRVHLQFLVLFSTLLFFSLFASGEPRNELLHSIKTIEAFPVARTLAAGFGFMGFAFLFGKRRFYALLLFMIGTFIHPLTIGWCIPIWFFVHFPKTKIWIVLFSVIAPMSILLNIGPFASYSADWQAQSWQDYIPIIQEMICYYIFFQLILNKGPVPFFLKKLLSSIIPILGIATYWLIFAVLSHHIFLSQIQPFRIVWVCHILGVFLTVWFIAFVYITKFRKNKKISFWGKIIALCAILLWVDSPFVLLLALVFPLASKKKFKKVLGIAAFVIWTIITIYISCWIWYLNHHSLPTLYYSYADQFQNVTAISAALALFLLVKFHKLRKILGILVFIEVVVCFIGTKTFPLSNFSFALTLMVFINNMLNAPVGSSFGLYRSASFLTAMMFLFAYENYDHRSLERKQIEHSMNQFSIASPFHYIVNRGKILFSVEKYGEKIPRLRFLSGGYLDYQSGVGEAFFRKQYNVVRLREMYIYNGSAVATASWDTLSWRQRERKIFSVLFNKDSLVQRATFLCSINEISHVITEKPLPVAAADSMILWYDNEKIRLYPCESFSNN